MRDAWRKADVMPIGSYHDESGWLREDGGQLALHRDAGGVWRLDAAGGARHMIGQRVRVVGRRGDFDLIEVSGVTAL